MYIAIRNSKANNTATIPRGPAVFAIVAAAHPFTSAEVDDLQKETPRDGEHPLFIKRFLTRVQPYISAALLRELESRRGLNTFVLNRFIRMEDETTTEIFFVYNDDADEAVCLSIHCL
jgi:hypothetical protein